jgi:prevent-host-death family protein
MHKRSLVDAKAHFSEIVDAAEHHGARVLILRHGKAAAAIVPPGDVLGTDRKSARAVRPSARAVQSLLGRFGKGNARESAVADLVRGRR